MTINQFRRKLYQTAKILGDVQAITHKKDPTAAIAKRVGRRIVGKLTGRGIGALFPPTGRK